MDWKGGRRFLERCEGVQCLREQLFLYLREGSVRGRSVEEEEGEGWSEGK